MTAAVRLQILPHDQAWAVADSNLLQSIAKGGAVEFGKRGSQLRGLVDAFSTVGLVYPFLWIVGLQQLIGLLMQQRRGTRLAWQAGIEVEFGSDNYPPRFFVGFGAGSEEVLYARYRRDDSDGVGKISQVDPGTMGAWHRVTPLKAVGVLVQALRNARTAIAGLPPELARWRLDFLTSAGVRIAHYAFMRAWFEDLRRNCPGLREVAFLAADTSAFAAIDAGLPTRYIQHGMTRHSLVFPRFARIDALTQDEATHFRRRLPAAAISLQLSPGPTITASEMSLGILIASVYGAPAEMQRIRSFIAWACAKDLQLWVRPHPREERSYWRGDAVETRIVIEDGDASFQEALARLRPRLVVSWYSTALAEALAMGVIPVSVSAVDDPNVADMVYPLFARCLRWPKDVGTIERVLDGDDVYFTELERMRRGWDGVPD